VKLVQVGGSCVSEVKCFIHWLARNAEFKDSKWDVIPLQQTFGKHQGNMFKSCFIMMPWLGSSFTVTLSLITWMSLCVCIYIYIYCNGFDQCIARQWLCKHSPTCNNRTTGLCNLFLGNGSVNTLLCRCSDVTTTVSSGHVMCFL
jgi:hypothetical protein